MLVSAVVDPRCFGPDSLKGPFELLAAELLLRGVAAENVVLLSADPSEFLRALIDQVSQLQSPKAQQLRLYVEEIGKNKKRCIASPANKGTASTAAQVACDLRADLVVCSDADELSEIAARVGASVECCTLPDVLESATDKRRRSWLTAHSLHDMEDAVAAEIVGRTVRYAHEIAVADKVIGMKAVKPGQAMSRFVQGIKYVVDQWRAWSPYSSRGLTLRVISVAGGSRAAHGYLEPTRVREAILAALDAGGVLRSVRQLEVELKQESDPPVFRDRFLNCARRCWQVDHGFDDIGKLCGRRNERSPTRLSPDCQAYRDHFQAIRYLKDAG